MPSPQPFCRLQQPSSVSHQPHEEHRQSSTKTSACILHALTAPDAATCQALHFKPVLYPQTDPSYGHCSYLTPVIAPPRASTSTSSLTQTHHSDFFVLRRAAQGIHTNQTRRKLVKSASFIRPVRFEKMALTPGFALRLLGLRRSKKKHNGSTAT